jgi:hypothetical protein
MVLGGTGRTATLSVRYALECISSGDACPMQRRNSCETEAGLNRPIKAHSRAETMTVSWCACWQAVCSG